MNNMPNNTDKHILNQEKETNSGASLDLNQEPLEHLNKDEFPETAAVVISGNVYEDSTKDVEQESYQAIRDAAEHKPADKEANPIFTQDMVLKLTSDEAVPAIVKTVHHELIVGRGDNITDYQPDIDLTPHGAYRLGLSRRHAIILREGDNIFVKDLNSRNGTFVNGVVVASGGKKIIHDGDDIRFGNLTLHASFEK